MYLSGQQDAPTAEALMRSRYTAFVLRDADYLLATWDPKYRPAQLDLKKDRTQWLGLQVLETEAGRATDTLGRVAFVARFQLDGSEQALRENSRFRKVGTRWFYLDGETTQLPQPASAAARPNVGRNDPCPCGSGQKYKRCCG